MLVISPSKKIKYVSRFFRKATKFLLKCKKENNTMKKDNLIFIHKLLKAIADSIIKLFLPLYILKQTNDINLAMLYLIIYSSCVMLTMFILKTIIQKFGVFAIMVHFIPIIVTMGLFSFLQIDITLVIIAAILMSFSQTLYSIPLNLIFTFGDKKTNVGKFQIASNIGKLTFTLISGYLLSSTIRNSFLILSIVSSIFYIGGTIPLFFSIKDLQSNYEIFKKTPNKKAKIDPWFIIFHISFGIFQPIMDNIVPLFLYINQLSFHAVTLMIALVEGAKIIINYLSHYLVKKKKALICVSISFLLFLISSFGMIFIKNSLWLYILSCTCSISFPLTFVPMFKLYCTYIRRTENVFSGMTRRDFEIFSFRPCLYSLSFIGFSLYPCLIIGIVAVPIMFLSEIKIIKKESLESIN